MRTGLGRFCPRAGCSYRLRGKASGRNERILVKPRVRAWPGSSGWVHWGSGIEESWNRGVEEYTSYAITGGSGVENGYRIGRLIWTREWRGGGRSGVQASRPGFWAGLGALGCLVVSGLEIGGVSPGGCLNGMRLANITVRFRLCYVFVLSRSLYCLSGFASCVCCSKPQH